MPAMRHTLLVTLLVGSLGLCQAQTTAGATSPNAQTVVVRVMAPQVEGVMALLRQVRLAWRSAVWNMAATSPRIWAM